MLVTAIENFNKHVSRCFIHCDPVSIFAVLRRAINYHRFNGFSRVVEPRKTRPTRDFPFRVKEKNERSASMIDDPCVRVSVRFEIGSREQRSRIIFLLNGVPSGSGARYRRSPRLRVARYERLSRVSQEAIVGQSRTTKVQRAPGFTVSRRLPFYQSGLAYAALNRNLRLLRSTLPTSTIPVASLQTVPLADTRFRLSRRWCTGGGDGGCYNDSVICDVDKSTTGDFSRHPYPAIIHG